MSKIFILSEAETFSTLSQFIPLESIPKQYGGTLDPEVGDVPAIEPAYADRITWKDDGACGTKTAKGELRRWPRGPIAWVQRGDGDLDLLAVGSVGGKQRREVVATFKLEDPYGGWADNSIPHPKHHDEGLASNGYDDAEKVSDVIAHKTRDDSANLPPPAITSLDASIPPVPLVAIAQPLPGE